MRPEGSGPGGLQVIAAFALLPFALALAAYLAFPLVWALGGHTGIPDGRMPGQWAMLTAVLTVLVSPIALTLVFASIRDGRASLQRLLLIGAALGNAPFAFYLVALVLPATVMHLVRGTLDRHLVPVTDLLAGAANAVIIGTSFGLLGAAVVWAIAVRPRSA